MRNGNGRWLSIAFYENLTLTSQCPTEFIICSTRKVSQHTLYGLVQPHLDYADIVWRDLPGLTTQIKQLQSFLSRIAKEIVKGKVTPAKTLTSLLWWVLFTCEAFWSSVLSCEKRNEMRDPRTFRCAQIYHKPTTRLNTWNGCMPKINNPRTEWGRNKTH